MSTIPVQNFELTDNTGETILYFERSPDYFKLRITPAASGAACFGDITLESGTAQVLLRAMVRSMRDCEEDPSASLAPVPDTKPHCGDLLLKTPAGNTVAAIRAGHHIADVHPCDLRARACEFWGRSDLP